MFKRLLPLALLATAALTSGCGSGDSASDAATAAPSSATDATPAAAAVKAIEAGDAELIDVRTQAEWDGGHAPQAQHFELSRLEAGELPGLPKDAAIYVYCRSGNRSGMAVALLEKAGYTNVTNAGGLADWQAAGGDVTS